MESFEDSTHSFIVRLWREPREIPGRPVLWRGMIEHVMTGQRRYVSDLDEIPLFIRQRLGPDQAEGDG